MLLGVFTELGADPSAQPVLLAWNPCFTEEDASRVAQILFDKVNVAGIYLAPAPLLALYASGRTSGCVLLSGDCRTYACSIHDGFVLPGTMISSSLAGASVTR